MLQDVLQSHVMAKTRQKRQVTGKTLTSPKMKTSGNDALSISFVLLSLKYDIKFPSPFLSNILGTNRVFLYRAYFVRIYSHDIWDMIVEFNVICRWKGESIDAFARYVTTCKSKGYETSLRTLNLEMKISDVQQTAA